MNARVAVMSGQHQWPKGWIRAFASRIANGQFNQMAGLISVNRVHATTLTLCIVEPTYGNRRDAPPYRVRERR